MSDADCTLQMSTNGGAFSAISQTMNRDLFNSFENEALTVTAGAHVMAGARYDVALNCNSFNPAVEFVRGDMTAVFVG